MPSSDYTPTTQDVGAIARSRTVDSYNNELGDFTADTKPTAVEMAVLISAAVDEVYPVFGEDIPDAPGSDPDALRKAAKRATALRAAAEMELTKFPEQVARGVSPYQNYMDAFESLLKRVATAIAEVEEGDEPGGGGSMSASYDFPVDTGGMVGWETRW